MFADIVSDIESPKLAGSMDNISINTDQQFIRVLIYFGSLDFPIYDEKLYPFQGSVAIYGFGLLANRILKDYDKTGDSFRIAVFSPEGNSLLNSSLFIVRCDRYIDAVSHLEVMKENFLTSRYYYRVAPDASVPIAAYLQAGESNIGSVKILYRDGDQTLSAMMGLRFPESSDNISSITFTPSAYADQLNVPHANILSAQIKLGSRMRYIFIDPSLSLRNVFVFKNMYGCADLIYIKGVTTIESSFTAQKAVSGNNNVMYDSSLDASGKFVGDSISHDESASIDQLLSSDKVFIYAGELNPALRQIEITDSKHSYSNSNDQPDSVEFSFIYHKNQPHAYLKKNYSAVATLHRIFTQHFKAQFK